ncbi:MAG: TadE/TadG family type IV pilus assembly protein [Bacillota bacterium]
MILQFVQKIWKDERGVSKVTIFSITFPFLMLCIISGLYLGIVGHAKGVTLQAAREASRTAAVHHDLSLAKQKAIDMVKSQLYSPTGTGGEAGEPHQPFDPDRPNPTVPDVQITEDSMFVYASVSYHVRCPVPGFPRFLNKNASPWDKWASVTAQAVFQKEYEP